METATVTVEVDARALSQTPLLGFSSTVSITLKHEFEEFILDESDGTFTSLGSYPASSSPFSNQSIFLKFQNFTPNYVYQHLFNRFHDLSLSQKISDQIVVEAEKQSQDLPLFMAVFVKLTQKVLFVVPSNSVPSTTDLETKSCAVCLENLSESESEAKPICQLPNCLHLFHEECVNEWLDRQNNSCPLCRQAVYTQPETE